ncbi:hypothetical protein QTP70_018860 [Hemibagrus guttatus]|uniref:Peptidylprolyl isomerase n=1 Tax=Hemibagrus guttatus TaxID=175788 RepID=A0AAE0PRL2_9TELE|nr:hypothetical protein QTP70_018860 [Hemibagrus guttatus]
MSEFRKMAEASISVDQDQFICPVCLDLLKDPVTIPCGHSFCKVCINDCWDQEDQSGVYSCPQCRDTFTPRPVLRRNNMLAEVVEKLKKTEVQAASPAHCYAGPGDVECDFCTGKKHKAIKSCLMCLASFCETHLKPHYEVPSWKKHKLIEASGNLQEKICSEHDKALEIYCRTDQSFICYLCTMDKHTGHNTVAAKAVRTEKESELKEEQMKFQQRIQEKQKKVQELKQTVNTIKLSAQTAVEDSERIFTELISSMEKKRSEVTELIRAQEKTELSRAERLLEQLEQEIADLQRRLTEMEQLSHTHDHIQFLQSFQSLRVSSGRDDSSSITVNKHLSFDGVRKSLSDLKKRLEEIFQEEFIKIPEHAAAVQMILPSEPKSREDFLHYFCDLTLDPNTVHYHLILSEKNRVVRDSERKQQYSDHPERFNYYSQVLSKESVCGRCYWEVEWSSEGYVYISVSYKDISRKGRGYECVFGLNDQSWSLVCSSSSLSFYHNNINTDLRVPSPSRIGVYVDHSAGTLSFYSVSDMKLLHRVHTTFTQPLYTGFFLDSYGSYVRLCDQNKILAIMAVLLETTLGDIVVDLYTEERPKACLNFLKLCKIKYYNYCLIHNVQRFFIIQTGDPTGTGRGGESVFCKLYGDQARFFDAEKAPRIKHKKKGTVSMVNNGNEQHGSQFLITTGENLDYLDGVHTAFGEVTEGMDVLAKINEAFVDKDFIPFQDIRINHTVILDDPFDDLPGLPVPDRSPEPTKQQLDSGRIGADEAINDADGKDTEELDELIKEKEAKTQVILLEMVGDLPDADIKPPENVLFVCKLNPVTTDEDLEIIFSRFGSIQCCEIIRDWKKGESLCYAFIEFEKATFFHCSVVQL